MAGGEAVTSGSVIVYARARPTREGLLRLDAEVQRVRGSGGALPGRVTDVGATSRGPPGFAERRVSRIWR